MLNLLVPSHDDAPATHLKNLITTLFPAQKINLFDDLQEALHQSSSDLVVVPILPPVEAIAHRLANGENPEQALEDWRTQARADLSAYRKARRRLVLFSLSALLTGNSESWMSFGQRLQCEPVGLETLDPSTLSNESGPSISSFYCLLAAQLLCWSPTAKAVADEIEAMLNGPYTSLDISPVLVEKVLQDQHYGAGQKRQSETENDLLRENLAKALHQIDDLHAEHKEAIAALKDQLSTRSAELETITHEQAVTKSEYDVLCKKFEDLLGKAETQATRQKNLEAELDAMASLEAKLSKMSAEMMLVQTALQECTNKLNQAQAQLAHTQQDHQRLQSERDQLAHDAAILSDTLTEVFASNSWKVTRPIRSIMSRIRPR